MLVTTTIEQTREALRGWPQFALVPTMGALHTGHASLIERARQLCPRVAVSIFVNPTQFGPKEDFERYPRPVERDLELCRQAGVDLVMTPAVEELYRPGEIKTVIDVPLLTGTLEGELRPGHFVGVCRVVAKLLHIFHPTVACFGEKDYQQLAVIRAMVTGLCMDVAIEPCPTVREADGLAMSSRNVYIDPQQRPHAAGLYKALCEARHLIERGETNPAAVESVMRAVIEAHHLATDYAVVRDARTLRPIDSVNPRLAPVVCLVAARMGPVRLIDSLRLGS